MSRLVHAREEPLQGRCASRTVDVHQLFHLCVVERNETPHHPTTESRTLFSSTCNTAVANKSLATISGGVRCVTSSLSPMASCVATVGIGPHHPQWSSNHIACTWEPPRASASFSSSYMFGSLITPSSPSRPFSTFKGSRISPLFVPYTVLSGRFAVSLLDATRHKSPR